MNTESLTSKILITGGAGFIGSHLANRLYKRGFDVSVVDNLSTGSKDNLESGIKFYLADILDDNLEKLFVENSFDVLFHFAAQTEVNCAQENPLNDAQQNILGSINLFSLCQKYNLRRIYAMSSAAVYGYPEKLPLKETDSVSPISFYGVSKLAMENYLRRFDLDWVILRPANVFDKNNNAKNNAGVVALFAEKMKADLPVEIYGDGTQTRDFVYVEDVVKVCEALLLKNISKKIINISTGKRLSLNEVFDIMKNYYNYNLQPIYREARCGDILHSVLDNSLCKELLGFTPQLNLQSVLDNLDSSAK